MLGESRPDVRLLDLVDGDRGHAGLAGVCRVGERVRNLGSRARVGELRHSGPRLGRERTLAFSRQRSARGKLSRSQAALAEHNADGRAAVRPTHAEVTGLPAPGYKGEWKPDRAQLHLGAAAAQQFLRNLDPRRVVVQTGGEKRCKRQGYWAPRPGGRQERKRRGREGRTARRRCNRASRTPAGGHRAPRPGPAGRRCVRLPRRLGDQSWALRDAFAFEIGDAGQAGTRAYLRRGVASVHVRLP